MLYPIELLRHTIVASRGSATDGEHVNGHAPVCHVIRRHIKCRHAYCNAAGRFTVHFAPFQKAIIADCNPSDPTLPPKSLFLKDLTAVRLLA